MILCALRVVVYRFRFCGRTLCNADFVQPCYATRSTRLLSVYLCGVDVCELVHVARGQLLNNGSVWERDMPRQTRGRRTSQPTSPPPRATRLLHASSPPASSMLSGVPRNAADLHSLVESRVAPNALKSSVRLHGHILPKHWIGVKTRGARRWYSEEYQPILG